MAKLRGGRVGFEDEPRSRRRREFSRHAYYAPEDGRDKVRRNTRVKWSRVECARIANDVRSYVQRRIESNGIRTGPRTTHRHRHRDDYRGPPSARGRLSVQQNADANAEPEARPTTRRRTCKGGGGGGTGSGDAAWARVAKAGGGRTTRCRCCGQGRVRHLAARRVAPSTGNRAPISQRQRHSARLFAARSYSGRDRPGRTRSSSALPPTIPQSTIGDHFRIRIRIRQKCSPVLANEPESRVKMMKSRRLPNGLGQTTA